MARDFYTEINKVVSEYEDGKPWHTRDINWATDRVAWCWKWRKITKEQMEELADRITAIFEGDNYV